MSKLFSFIPLPDFLTKNSQVILYGLSLAALLFLLKWIEARFVVIHYSLDLYIGCIALIFTGLGVWLALKLRRPKIQTRIVEKEILVQQTPFVLNEEALASLNMSRRELDVLELMAQGLSNQEIADRLFVSLNTIKTHAASVFGKLEVDRRTQAVDKAKRLRLIA